MIEKAEIDRKSEELGVHASNVQRDYVFGWLLSGIFQPTNPLHERLILKGGNAFRKAYFQNARFSNDLDFSIQADLDENVLRDSLRQACVFAKDNSGVEFLPDENRIGLQRAAEEESKVYEARVYFKSFYGEEEITLKVKLDVKEYDRIFLPIQTRRLIHAYSDADLCQAELRCHKLEELLAAKLKALLLRTHSPDLYDFVYSIFFQKSLNVRRLEVITTFLKKTIYEPSPKVAKNLLLKLPFRLIQSFWNKYLVCPRISLIDFQDAESQFRVAIGELFELLEPQYAFGGFPRPAGLSYFDSPHRDIIIEAGQLQRVLRIVYDGFERLVEPYSLVFKRRKDGIALEYFYAWDTTGGRSRTTGIKSFIADKVQLVEMTEQSYTPRFPVELAKPGSHFGKPFSGRSPATIQSFPVTSARRGGSPGNPLGVSYTIECPYCGKRFQRPRPDTALRSHKDKCGNACYGRVGIVV